MYVYTQFALYVLCTHMYCMRIQVDPAVRRLMEMGFAEDKVRSALSDNRGDENAAVEQLLSSL